MKTLEDEWYVVVKAYMFTIFERFFIIIYCVSALSLHIESADSMILYCCYQEITGIWRDTETFVAYTTAGF